VQEERKSETEIEDGGKGLYLGILGLQKIS
jgi:hypothetical protein